jgi:2-desacetyl-2-hydroxyethyl bacteriochlorophyllide A dehydrogenase
MNTMKAITIEGFGGVDKLQMKDLPIPKPGDTEVQFLVLYSGVNPVDWKIREGLLQKRLPHEFPLIPGWEAAGKITAIGKNVKNFKVGDEVFAYCRKPIIKWGTYAEYVCADAGQVALKPKNINFAQAAAIPLTSLTAWQALFDAAKLRKGETILIHAGAGGVGGLAIQFAKNAGAKVITTASQKNHSYVKKLGADHVIDYTKENFVEAVKKLAPGGVDVVFDTVGGKTLQESLKVLKQGGRLVSIVEHLDPEIATKHHIQFSYVLVDPNGVQLKHIADLISEGKVIPPSIEEIPLAKAAEAQDKVREGHTQGKIVLKVK